MSVNNNNNDYKKIFKTTLCSNLNTWCTGILYRRMRINTELLLSLHAFAKCLIVLISLAQQKICSSITLLTQTIKNVFLSLFFEQSSWLLEHDYFLYNLSLLWLL